MRGVHAGTFRAETADFLQGARDAERIPGELHGGSVREKFPLAAHGGLNQMSKKNSNVTHDEQGETEEGQGIFIAAAPARLEQNPSDDRQAKYSENNSQQTEIQP